MSIKYPRTPHLTGSGIPDSNSLRLDFSSIVGKDVVYEEKIDGTEVSFFFDEAANLVLRERANPLDFNQRGGSEKLYDRLKDWLSSNDDKLFDLIGDQWLFGLSCGHANPGPSVFTA